MSTSVDRLPESQARGSLPEPITDRGPRVQFARFVDNGEKIQLFSACTKDVAYYAISHVWGKTEWQYVRCLGREIDISPQKAKFLEERMYGLVGDVAFWMDTITVNQKDPAEVISTVQAIPAIFRDAEKTIAIREGDSIYNCCVEAVAGFPDYAEMLRMLLAHVGERHSQSVFEESYLKRLWTLQEVLLSHTIQFVVSTDVIRTEDALYSLAETFTHGQNTESTQALVEFMRAYITGGTVHRSKPPARRFDEDIFSNSFVEYYVASNRVATKSRDYIFATMPQFPWYHYPKEAERMLFSEIFSDFYGQAVAAGHSFSSRITQSMTDLQSLADPNDSWGPSKDQPEPKSLGDFLKLLGHRLDLPPEGQGTPIHFATVALVSPFVFSSDDPIDETLALIESAMRFSPWTWSLSHKAGELSKYGAYPESAREISLLKALLKDGANRDQANVMGIHEAIAEEGQRRASEEWIIPQAMKILDLMFGTVDKYQNNAVLRSEWHIFRNGSDAEWPADLRRAMIFLAAMVSCQVPLSAYEWAQKHFMPVRVDFRESGTLLGLLARGGSGETSRGLPGSVYVAGRHVSRVTRGRDIVLVDPKSKVPIGLLPDFAHPAQPAGEFVRRMHMLYGQLVITTNDGQNSMYMHVPLSAIDEAPRP
ncbi:hypothetical protein DL768_001867 [Monosporascus sp. mg162]|nr:hypothetical protein DL768_001867 [Monosporascus sp. mg162]